MGWWRQVLRWSPWSSRQLREEDLERELRAHLDLETEERLEAGLAAKEARYAAQLTFGNTTLIQEETRAVWRSIVIEQVTQDVRYALRGLRNSAGFTFVAVLSLALGIGATTAVFSVLNTVVLRPLPVADPGRLALLQPQLRGKRFPLFNPLFEELRASQQSISGMFAVSDEPYLKAAFDHAAPMYVRGSLVSGNYFQVLGLSPAAGRLLTEEDDTIAAANCAAVVSHAFWTEALRGDPAILGQPVTVREKVCMIVGVAPAGFQSHQSGYAPDVWLPIRPLSDPKLLASRSMAFFSGVMGRLRQGRTIRQSEAELTTLYQRMQPANQPAPRPGEAPPKPGDFQIVVAPGAQGTDAVRRQFSQALGLALAVVGVVLLIAAVNVANLLLARGAARGAEFATRAALGAGRARLMRLLAIEGGVLAVLGGFLGLTLAWVATPALAKVVSLSYIPLALDTTLDARVLGVAAAATVLAVLLTGVLPAFRLSGPGLQTGMASVGRATGARSRQRLTRTLVASQLALSLLLVTAAGLLLRTMLRVLAVDPGFNTNNVVMMDIRDTEPAARFGETDGPAQKARRAALYRELDQKLNSIAGVESASLSWLGLFGGNYVGLNVYDVDQPENKRFTLVDYVSPRYFESVGMRVVHGRGFSGADGEGSVRVAVVNEAFVRERIEIGKEAIGRRMVMTYADDRRPWNIVGVVRDAKYNDLREQKAEPMMWTPLAQAPVKITSISMRVRPGTGVAVIRQARAALAAASPYLMVRDVTTLRAHVDRTTTRERLLLNLASGFGGIALLLASVGLYGIFAYAVARRRREIGIRLALGAQRGAVVRSVLYEALALAAAGIAAGIPLSLAAGYLLRSFLFGVTAYDVLTLAGAGTALTTVALLAAYGPARRASNIDPVIALKYE
jgi:predicted permease